MPTDAKLGLVVGVGLVIVVAVVFFRKDTPAVDPAAATIVQPAPAVTPPGPSESGSWPRTITAPRPAGNDRTVEAKTTGRTPEPEGDPSAIPHGNQ
jgi:hypothetical protein